MAQNKEWGNTATLTAAAELYGAKIIVIEEDTLMDIVPLDKTKMEHVFVLAFVEKKNYGHYEAVEVPAQAAQKFPWLTDPTELTPNEKHQGRKKTGRKKTQTQTQS